jgi:hypothetical protein
MQTRNLSSCSHNRVFDEGRHPAERGHVDNYRHDGRGNYIGLVVKFDGIVD